MSDQSVSNKIISFDQCVSDLEFIFSIPAGHKPCYSSQTSIDKNAWFATIRRRWESEKGEYGIIYVTNVLDSCDNYYRMCLNQDSRYDNNMENLAILRTAINNAIMGFDRLIETYEDQGNVKEGYQHCKTKANDISNNISQYLARQIEKSDHTSDESDEYIYGFTNCFRGGWGYDNNNDNGDCDSEKKSMKLSIVSPNSEESSCSKFFTTNNMVLLKPKK